MHRSACHNFEADLDFWRVIMGEHVADTAMVMTKIERSQQGSVLLALQFFVLSLYEFLLRRERGEIVVRIRQRSRHEGGYQPPY